MAESKHDKFIRLRDARLPNALKQMELLTNLTKPGYEYAPEEAEDLINTLQDAVKEMAFAFGVESRLGAAFDTLLKEGDDPGACPASSLPDAPAIKPVYGVTAPTWAQVRDMAEQCPLEELGHAMTIYLTRVDEELFMRRKAKR